ncbi:MAG: hypothetical protein ABMA01_23050 [Chthoniobacteraceae bacterium]
MSATTSFEDFEKELSRLVESFGKRLTELKQPGYAEAQLRDDFLNLFFRLFFEVVCVLLRLRNFGFCVRTCRKPETFAFVSSTKPCLIRRQCQR